MTELGKCRGCVYASHTLSRTSHIRVSRLETVLIATAIECRRTRAKSHADCQQLNACRYTIVPTLIKWVNFRSLHYFVSWQRRRRHSIKRFIFLSCANRYLSNALYLSIGQKRWRSSRIQVTHDSLIRLHLLYLTCLTVDIVQLKRMNLGASASLLFLD